MSTKVFTNIYKIFVNILKMLYINLDQKHFKMLSKSKYKWFRYLNYA